MIIAVDFDGTIVENAYPSIGELRRGFSNNLLIEELKDLQKKGNFIILWTCRCGKELEDAVAFCNKFGLTFDSINDDLEEVKLHFNNGMEEWSKSGKARKVFADVYIDDRALSVFQQLNETKYLGELR